MADVTITAQLRTLMGKKVGRLRRQGIIPGNVYGAGIASVPVQIELRALRDVLIHAGRTTVVDLHVRAPDGSEDGKTHPVLLERITRHPASGQVLHVDFHQVDLNKPVRAAVPVTLVGEAPAAGMGAVLFHPLDTLEVEALPRNLPHAIEVDVSVLKAIDDGITVADLRLPAGVTIDTDPATLVVRAVASKLERELEAEQAAVTEAAEAAAAAEPAAAGEAPAAEAPGTETPPGSA